MDTNDSEQRREEFINAAEKLFKENGVVETTVNAIVKELDVAKGLFYYYFKSKDDVIEAISKKYNDSFKKSIMAHSSANNYDEELNEYKANLHSRTEKIKEREIIMENNYREWNK